ncbi:Ribonuclease T2 [Merluccius polli]|uniref:Ribonuclease T2 n=1 Tax=Merluccius polli TaxID=89951 RepID=A0AA47MPV7_MERPO|nr:Ribonuclease T2 [Merluccius polli]
MNTEQLNRVTCLGLWPPLNQSDGGKERILLLLILLHVNALLRSCGTLLDLLFSIVSVKDNTLDMTLPSVLLLFLGAAMVSSASVLSPQPDKGQFCNSSWTFNSSLVEVSLLGCKHVFAVISSLIEMCQCVVLCDVNLFVFIFHLQDLMPDMEKSWPDLIKPNTTGFWKYEWSKHGTCAAQEEIMNSQHKYFSKGLELYHKVDLDSVLKKLNITPSAQYYNFAAIESAIENFYGVKPKIQCAHPTKEKDSQTLAQIEICFNHDMTFLNCEKESVGKGVARPSALGVCDHNIPVYYPPLSLGVQ